MKLKISDMMDNVTPTTVETTKPRIFLPTESRRGQWKCFTLKGSKHVRQKISRVGIVAAIIAAKFVCFRISYRSYSPIPQ